MDKCPSPFHAVHEIKTTLLSAGFQELKESESWKIEPLKKYFVTRNHSTIIAFAVGGKFTAGNGFSIVGAHTDSPCLKVKPISKKNKSGYEMVGVELYGGGIWHTWFDRDLTVGGRVLVRNGEMIDHKLVHVKRPILRVPNIAIHLYREHNTEFGPNKENHVCPVLATAVQSELQGEKKPEKSESPEEMTLQADKHQPALIKLLCEEMNVKREDILDFELYVADTQNAAIGGVHEEFIFSPRLDNLLNAFAATQALVDTCDDLSSETNIRMISLFDNEEVGSTSAQGAESSLQEWILRRLSSGGSQTAFEEAIPKSYMISADQAHAVHPNYSEKHESNHQPTLHKGIVLKINSNQRYATTSITTTILREIARKVNVPLQDFVVRNDSPCGSTIGPLMSAKLGMSTIDIGAPQLSMHSIREMCCTSGVYYAKELYKVREMEDEPSRKVPNEVYRFGVQWCGERAVLQLNFLAKNFTLFQRGYVKHTYRFDEYKDFIIDSQYDRLFIQFLKRSLTLSVDDGADKEILDYLFKVIKTIMLNKKTNKSNFTGIVCQIFSGSRPLRILPQTVVKEGVVMKKGNSMLPRWEKRLLRVRLGEIMYSRIGDIYPLNVSRIWEEGCILSAIDRSGFSLSVEATSRIYFFKVLEENKTDEQILRERWEWMEVLRKCIVSKYTVINAPRNLFIQKSTERLKMDSSNKQSIPASRPLIYRNVETSELDPGTQRYGQIQRQLTCQAPVRQKEESRGLNTL